MQCVLMRVCLYMEKIVWNNIILTEKLGFAVLEIKKSFVLQFYTRAEPFQSLNLPKIKLKSWGHPQKSSQPENISKLHSTLLNYVYQSVCKGLEFYIDFCAVITSMHKRYKILKITSVISLFTFPASMSLLTANSQFLN